MSDILVPGDGGMGLGVPPGAAIGGPGHVFDKRLLQPGDILLERMNRSNPVHLGIALAQRLNLTGHSKSSTVHVGICIRGGPRPTVGQSHGAGLTEDPLDGHERWKVYRHEAYLDIPLAASVMARKLIAQHAATPAFGAYDAKRSAGSALIPAPHRLTTIEARIEAAYDQINRGEDLAQRGFFCSNFVAFCYALASRGVGGFHPLYLLPFDFERATPAEMAVHLDSPKARDRGWVRKGEITG